MHPRQHSPYSTPRTREAGWGLIEALVALLVLVLGVLALLHLQARLLTNSRDSAQSALAISLSADLRERLVLNIEGAQSDFYLRNFNAPVMSAAQRGNLCTAQACNAQELANLDLSVWIEQVQQTLAGGDAQIFHPQGSPEQLGILISWQRREDDALPAPPGCPNNSQCYLSYVTP